MKKTDIAYIAGLIDGEGYIGIKRTTVRKDCQNRSYHARIQIRMVDEEAIKFIAKTLGGNYYYEQKHSINGRPLFCYQVSDLNAENILKTIYPYLKVKQKVAKSVIEFRELQSKGNEYRTKITGYRRFPNSIGTIRQVPNLSYSDEYIEQCEHYYSACKQFNKVGV